MNIPNGIISISIVRHTWYVTEKISSLTGIFLCVVISSVIEKIWIVKDTTRDEVV